MNTLSIRWTMIILLSIFSFVSARAQMEEGLASYYHTRFHDNEDYVAAHRTLPFGTFVRVTNLKNMKSVIVSIMDRGPRKKSRIIDVSAIAARELDFVRAGITRVRIEVVPGPEDLRFLELMYPKIPYLPVEEAKKEFNILIK